MSSRSIVVLPRLAKLLAPLGENLKLGRLRRKLTTAQVAERAGTTRTTLWQVEKGAPHVSMGAYAQVLFVLGMEEDLLKLATDDELGRRLQDAQLVIGKRVPKKK
ncbi:MAG TPA: helix-turn-helix transcriptional regulator [Puia sp.]|nr:helix-turn-helix transcriptional regulator [Puia sp.]